MSSSGVEYSLKMDWNCDSQSTVPVPCSARQLHNLGKEQEITYMSHQCTLCTNVHHVQAINVLCCTVCTGHQCTVLYCMYRPSMYCMDCVYIQGRCRDQRCWEELTVFLQCLGMPFGRRESTLQAASHCHTHTHAHRKRGRDYIYIVNQNRIAIIARASTQTTTVSVH